MAHGEDLVTRDGTVYHDYKVLSHDAGYLTIMYSDGGGKIPLSNLPDDLQKQYGYNQQQADAFVQASIAQDRLDKQAIAKEEEAHQHQMATQVQPSPQVQTPPPVQASPQVASSPQVEASPPVIISPPSVAASPVQRGTGPGTPPGAAPAPPQPVFATPSTHPASEEDIAAIKGKITDLKLDILFLKTSGSTSELNQAKLVDDNQKLVLLRTQLSQMELSRPRKTLSWDEVKALHEQIVDLEDDVAQHQTDSNSDDVRTKLVAQDKIDDDGDAIAQIRETLGSSPKEPIKLSPSDVADLKQKMADLKADMDEIAARPSGETGDGGPHQSNDDAEQLEVLQEELIASGNP